MAYDRRWLDEPHGGDHVGRAAWALGEVRRRRAAAARCSSRACVLLREMLPALAGSSSPRTHGLRRARARRAPTRTAPARRAEALLRDARRPARSTLLPRQPRRRLALVRGRADLRQRPAAAGADRGRRAGSATTDLVARGLEALDWYGDAVRPRRAPGLRLVGNRGARAAAQPPAAGRRRRAAARRRRAGRGAGRGVRGDRRPAPYARTRVRAFEWFLGAQPARRAVYDFATGGCHDGLGATALNDNEGAESTLAFLQALLALDAAGLAASIAAPDEARAARADRLAHAAAPLRAVGARHRACSPTAWSPAASTSRCSPRSTRSPRATLDGVCARPYEEDPRRSTGGSGRRCTSRTASSAPASSTSSTTTSTGCRWRFSALCAGADGHDDPRLLRARDPARLPARPLGATWRSPTPTGSPSSTTRPPIHHGVDVGSAAVLARPAATSSSASAASTPTRAPHEAIEIARAAGRPLVLCGHRAGRALLRRARSSRTSTATASATSARSAARERAEVLGRRRRAAAPDRASPSRSGSRSSSRWSAARRSSPTRAARCPRSSTRA